MVMRFPTHASKMYAVDHVCDVSTLQPQVKAPPLSHPRPGGWGAERFTTVDGGPGLGSALVPNEL